MRSNLTDGHSSARSLSSLLIFIGFTQKIQINKNVMQKRKKPSEGLQLKAP